MSLPINKLRTWLSATRITLIFGVIYFISQVSIAIILEPVGADAVLQLQTTFSAETFVQIIEQWKEAGTLPYYLKHFYLDFPHPIWYSIFLASLVARAMNANNFEGKFDLLILLPFVAGLSDLMENTFHLIFLTDMNRVTPQLVFVSALFCNLKWLLCGLSLVFVTVFGIRSRFSK